MPAAGVAANMGLQERIDDMRSLIECKICLRPLYEPYMLACGHTYCYGCLDHFFNSNGDRRGKKTCPDCRTVVKAQPAPNYIVRDLSHMFTATRLLLSDGDSIDEHRQGQEEEAALIAKHKSTEGLFRGLFKDRGFTYPERHMLYDAEDGVHRCPMCLHEMEDGHCPTHGYLSDSDIESSDEDGAAEEIYMAAQPFHGLDLDTDDGHSGEEDEDGLHQAGVVYSSDDDADDDSILDRYDLEDDFIDNVNEDDEDGIAGLDDTGLSFRGSTPYESDDDNEDEETPVRPNRQRRRVVEEDDEDDGEDVDVDVDVDVDAQFSDISDMPNSLHGSQQGEEDDDDDDDIRPAVGRRRRIARTLVDSDDDDEPHSLEVVRRPWSAIRERKAQRWTLSSVSSEGDDSDASIRQPITRPVSNLGFAPLPISDDEDSNDSQSEAEDESVVPESSIVGLDEQIPDDISASDQSLQDYMSDVDSASSETVDNESDSHEIEEVGELDEHGEESDDTARPAQTQQARRTLLIRKRKRRPIVPAPTTMPMYSMPRRHGRRERSTTTVH